MRGTLTALVAITCISVNARDAQAGWPFPGEVSTAEGYNRLYCTEYDTSGPAGLAALVADRGQAMQELWTTDDVAQVQVLAWDSSVAGALYLMAYGLEGVVYLPVYDPGPWTPVSRGWLPDYGSALIDLDALLTSHGLDPASTLFSFTLGANDQRILDAQDTQRLAGLEPGEFLLGYNDGGLTASDRDANEPLILGLKPVEDRIDWCPEGYNLIVGTDGDDELVGTNGPDCIFGLGGNDTIKGKQGDDRIFGGRGDDHLQGNRGNDFLDGGSCHDLVRGGKGDDVLYGGPGDDELRGWQGTDALFGGDGNDILRGGPGVDLLVGGAGDDELRGGKDPDELHGGDGDDYLYGGQGGDIVSGGAGNDVIHGGQGGDILFGGPGNDEMHGQAGPDYLNGGTGNDEVHGGADDDYLDGGEGTDDLRGKKGVDVCVNGEIIHKSCEGTEAAAVTSVSILDSAPAPVMFNRPFVYVIREHHSGTILFIGKMMEPPAGSG